MGRPASVDLDDGDIRLGICSHHFALKRPFVGERHFNFRRLGDHVIVRHNVPVGRHNHAAAQRVFALLAGNLGKHVPEKLPEKRIVHKRRLLNSW